MDRRIRRYVAAKRKLIALLEEERQAVVNRAVARGLDPSARLKPSGVEWLGDVPEHWEVRRLKIDYAGIEERWTGITAESTGKLPVKYPVYGVQWAAGVCFESYTHDGAFDGEAVWHGWRWRSMRARCSTTSTRGQFWAYGTCRVYKLSNLRHVGHDVFLPLLSVPFITAMRSEPRNSEIRRSTTLGLGMSNGY